MIISARKFVQRAYLQTFKCVKSYKKNEDGAVAIEFAIISVPFFMLLFSIIEISLVFIAEINMTQATYETARMIRTQQGGIDTADEFKTEICNRMHVVPNCQSNLQVEVMVHAEFDDVEYGNHLNTEDELRDDFVYQKGGPNSIVTVRTFLEWDLFAQLPNFGLGNSFGFSNMANGNRLIQGFAAFRNEPL